ncbi:hypothetical protein [Streptomyces sp. NBC_01462]|uniref:hypothetical protein n=1 Tax=Streptomyces sp. NBC_01462 TaxID=2903876 RepID=UPI002E37DD04|nr:hypothetical protein [Streptomyces sp. NBC_01462]
MESSAVGLGDVVAVTNPGERTVDPSNGLDELDDRSGWKPSRSDPKAGSAL